MHFKSYFGDFACPVSLLIGEIAFFRHTDGSKQKPWFIAFCNIACQQEASICFTCLTSQKQTFVAVSNVRSQLDQIKWSRVKGDEGNCSIASSLCFPQRDFGCPLAPWFRVMKINPMGTLWRTMGSCRVVGGRSRDRIRYPGFQWISSRIEVTLVTLHPSITAVALLNIISSTRFEIF